MLRIASLTVAGLLVAASPGLAAPITIDLTSPSAEYQMSSQSPCVIGGAQCNSVEPAGFGFTLLPTGGGSKDYVSYSPVYTVAQIEAFVGSAFFVGIDVNSTAGNETTPATEELELFQIIVNGVVEWEFSDPAGAALFIPRNGTGWSDGIMTPTGSTGFDLSGFSDSDTVQFHAIIRNATDGRENIFLVNTQTPECPPEGCDVVSPEPMMMALFGTGLFVAGMNRFRRREQ